jgi:type I restriction enzyme S subunit
MTGSSGRQRVPINSLSDFVFYLPPLEEQQKIANILGSLDDKIELNRQINQTLEAMARAIFKSWFVDFDPVYAKMEGRDYPLPPEIMDLFPEELEESELGLIPKGWRVGTVGDIAENPKNVVHPNEVNEATYYVGLEHMPRKNIALDTWDYSEKVTSNKYAFCKGNILFGKLRPYFHKVGITPVDGICSTDIIVVNGKDNDYQNFLLFLLSSTVFVDSVSAASTGTKMPRTDWKYMQSYEIPLPPEIILQKFNSIVKSMVEKIVLNIHTSKNLENFRDVLLPKLMKGELDL